MGKIRKKNLKKISEETESNPTFEDQLEDILLNKIDNLDDDVKSTKSLKSLKSRLSIKQLSKVNKTKLKRKMLLKKIGDVTNTKHNRTKNNTTDTIINDRLPSLSSLLVSTTDKIKVTETKKKPIQKLKKRKRNLIDGVEMYKNVIKSKDFKNDPIGAVLQQVKQRLDNSNL